MSKALSYILRHAAEREGLKMNAQGYANVADVVRKFGHTSTRQTDGIEANSNDHKMANS